eukprot:3622799-Alexandrium_andersonii.AAC.1
MEAPLIRTVGRGCLQSLPELTAANPSGTDPVQCACAERFHNGGGSKRKPVIQTMQDPERGERREHGKGESKQ